jgi:cell wall assembly regulator SMI1
MGIIEKWNELVSWQGENLQKKSIQYKEPISEEQIKKIEDFLGEEFPAVLRELYSRGDGEMFIPGDSENMGALFGHGLVDSDEIIGTLSFSHPSLKRKIPENPTIDNPDKSNELIRKIADFYLSKAPKRKLFGFKKSWHKIKVTCGIGSYRGPQIYFADSESKADWEILKIDEDIFDALDPVLTELHELEKESYNWDVLDFVFFEDGKIEVERRFVLDDQEYSLSSSPEGAIKLEYFHYKWIPVFKDHGGNYIGIDLDPDKNGIKGQIIVFGRDEEDMFVIAEDLESFFDLLLDEVKNNKETEITELHLHDALRSIKND